MSEERETADDRISPEFGVVLPFEHPLVVQVHEDIRNGTSTVKSAVLEALSEVYSRVWLRVATPTIYFDGRVHYDRNPPNQAFSSNVGIKGVEVSISHMLDLSAGIADAKAVSVALELEPDRLELNRTSMSIGSFDDDIKQGLIKFFEIERGSDPEAKLTARRPRPFRSRLDSAVGLMALSRLLDSEIFFGAFEFSSSSVTPTSTAEQVDYRLWYEFESEA